MTPLVVILIVVAVLTLGLVALQIALRGPMPAGRRRLFERVMIWGLCPSLAILWTARSGLAAIVGEWLWMAGALVLGLGFAGQGLILFRKPVMADGTRT